jgi:saccharopine dehydrogenase (NAD+, L-lysine-forming)
MKVAVLGAAGTIAGAIVRDLAESDEVGELLLLDREREQAARVAAEQGGGRATAVRVDALQTEGGDALADALQGCDVLVNSASYRINLRAMEAALAAGCHYLDLGGLFWMTAEQLKLHDRFAQAGRLGLLGIGSSPGKTNVMAVVAVRALTPDRVLRIDVSAASRDPLGAPRADGSAGPEPLRLPYALQTLLDEITLPPVVLHDGVTAEIAPLTDGGIVRFDDPIGPAPTINTLHSELQTFGPSFGCREASFRLSLPVALLERLRALAGRPPEEIDAVARQAVRQSAQTVSCHVIEATSERRQVRVSAVTRPMESWGLGGGVVSTAAPAAAAVRLLARGQITATGVLPPERCIEPGDLFAELQRRGCTFATEITERAAA